MLPWKVAVIFLPQIGLRSRAKQRFPYLLPGLRSQDVLLVGVATGTGISIENLGRNEYDEVTVRTKLSASIDQPSFKVKREGRE